MGTQVVLLRGVNVGGKNGVSMAGLRDGLETLGATNPQTYLNSGNAIVDTELAPAELAAAIEAELPRRFRLDTELLRVHVLPEEDYRAVVVGRPNGFGEQPDLYHSDAIFLIGIDIADAMAVFQPREGVDAVWPGVGVVYSQRLSAERTKSRLSKIMASPLYKSMTIRSWQTTTKLVELLDARRAAAGTP
ncbi:MAG: DUF1697 domain-containing protein [Microbacteriaceae bacterium]|nr:DUF1697 domain-containing protein [Microbacteriaceae bacterium]